MDEKVCDSIGYHLQNYVKRGIIYIPIYIVEVLMDSIESRKIIEKLQALSCVLEKEGVNPITAIQGFILSGDPSYICVHKGGNRDLKHEIAKIDSYDLLEAVLKTTLSK